MDSNSETSSRVDDEGAGADKGGAGTDKGGEGALKRGVVVFWVTTHLREEQGSLHSSKGSVFLFLFAFFDVFPGCGFGFGSAFRFVEVGAGVEATGVDVAGEDGFLFLGERLEAFSLVCSVSHCLAMISCARLYPSSSSSTCKVQLEIQKLMLSTERVQ